MAITDEVLNELLKDYQKPEDLLGQNGLLKQLQKRLLEKAMGAELTVHLGYGKHDPAGRNSGNSRNGTSPKTLKGEFGNLELATPRDRNGSFEPQIVAKGQRRFEGFDQAIISLYSRGLTTREIEGHLLEIYGVEVSPALVSQVTDAVCADVQVWQNRPLEEVYPIVYFDALWGHMHWGHARRRDLANWEHLPIALWPSLDKGEEHVFSGGAIAAADGRPRLFYTSIGQRDPEQWMAMPVDDELVVWEKYPRNPVVTLKNHGSLPLGEGRGPFLFREAGRTYMVCGGNTNSKLGGGGAVQLYEAANPNLTEWRHSGVVFQYRDRAVWNIECPNLFKLGSQWVLLISPQNPCEYFVGSLDLARGKFTPDTHGVLDPGQSYASNISYDDRGRTLLWLWGRTDFDPAKGWQCSMTMPRVLSIDEDGFLLQNPTPEFETLRGDVRTMPAAPLDLQPLAASFAGDCLEIEAAFTLEQADAVGLRVRVPVGGGKPAAEIAYTPGNGLFSVSAAGAPIGRRKQVRMRVFLDRGVRSAEH